MYLRLRSNTAWAHAINHDEQDVGFVVLTQEYDHDGLVVFVWVIYCTPDSWAKHRPEAYAELSDFARKAGAKRIRMQSPRKGWARDPFFNPIATVYEHEL